MGTALNIFYGAAAIGGAFFLCQTIYFTRSAGRLSSRDQYVANKEFHRVMGLDGKYPSRREMYEMHRQANEEMDELRALIARQTAMAKVEQAKRDAQQIIDEMNDWS